MSSCWTLSKLRNALESLPQTLDETYDRILCGLNPSYKREILHVLQWLTFSQRPLRLEEIAEVFAFDEGNDVMAKFNCENRLSDPKEILEICSSLVDCIDSFEDYNDEYEDLYTDESVSSSNNPIIIVRLAHFSVKEYLVSDRIRTGSAAFFGVRQESANAAIATTCLSCLHMYDKISFPDGTDFSNEFSLAQYAATHWFRHLPATSDGSRPHPLAVELLLSQRKLENWIYHWDPDFPSIQYDYGSSGSPLYYAVLTGLENLVETLIIHSGGTMSQAEARDDEKPKTSISSDWSALKSQKQKAYINATGGDYYTPLQVAAKIGRINIVRLLLNYGADPNIFGGRGTGSALSAAAESGSLEIVELLLDMGADIHEGLCAKSENNWKASNAGGELVFEVRQQISKDANDDIIDEVHDNLPWLGKSDMYDKTDEESFRLPLDVPHRCAIVQHRVTALYAAAQRGDLGIVKCLLDRGAMIEPRNDQNSDTALHAAAQQGNEAMVRLLLDRGALLDKSDERGRTPLDVAASKGTLAIVKCLLDRGAIIDLRNDLNGDTVLHTAAKRRNEAMVRLLLDRGALLDKSNMLGETPLRVAHRKGYKKIVGILLDHGYIKGRIDDFYRKPLDDASHNKEYRLVKLLIEKRAAGKQAVSACRMCVLYSQHTQTASIEVT